jgi:hypothetical protein
MRSWMTSYGRLRPLVDIGVSGVYTYTPMAKPTKRQRYNFWLDADLRDGLRAVADRDGIPESEQIRRAIRHWLEEKGIKLTPVRTPRR